MPTPPTDADLRDLAILVRTERVHRGMTIDDAAAATGMSPVTWGKVENGRLVRSLTYGAIEQTFEWPRGSIEAYLRDRKIPPSRVVDALPDYIRRILDEEELPEGDRLKIVELLQTEYARDEREQRRRREERVRLVIEAWRQARTSA